MEVQSQDALVLPMPRVTATFRLGSENYSVCATNGILSTQLISVKDQCMSILKEYITRNNAPLDVPDEPLDGCSDDDSKIPVRPSKLKKIK